MHKILFLYVNSVSGLYLQLRNIALGINLPFDMCRWLVEGEDVGVVHEVLVRHHQLLTSRPLPRLYRLQLPLSHKHVQ